MDYNAQDSIDALQALLNFKRSAQVTSKRTQELIPEISRTRSVPSKVPEAESAFKTQTQVRANYEMAPSIHNKPLAAAKLEETKLSASASSINNTRAFEKLPFNSTRIINARQQPNIPTQPETTMRFNPFLFGQKSDNYQIHPFSLPLNTANPLHVETLNSISSRSQIPSIPHTFSIPATFISPKEDIKKPPAQTPILYAKDSGTGAQTSNLASDTSHANIVTSVKLTKNPIHRGQSAAIRSEEVEAALRSKPQRGKKRNNLSVLERLELTRTRNREHAKCTRYVPVSVQSCCPIPHSVFFSN